MQDETQNTVQSKSQKVRHWLQRHRKKVIIVAVVLLVVLVAALSLRGSPVEKYITQTIFRSGAENAILSSLENTLKLDQLKFHTEFHKQLATASSYQQDLTVDGMYKKGAGLSASADSTVDAMGAKLLQKSRWVIDTSNNTYVNLQSLTTTPGTGGPVTNTPAINQQVAAIEAHNNNANKDAWSKYSGNQYLKGTYSLTGVNGCMLKLYADTEANPQQFLALVAQLATSTSMQKTASNSGTDTYVLKITSSTTISELYLKSELYKWLVDCNADEYSTTAKTLTDSLKNLTVTVKVDTTKSLLSSLEIASKGMFDATMTFAMANDVTITVPQNASPILTTQSMSSDKVKQQYPYDYQHIQDAVDASKYGACYNLDKYRAYAPPEAVAACAAMGVH